MKSNRKPECYELCDCEEANKYPEHCDEDALLAKHYGNDCDVCPFYVENMAMAEEDERNDNNGFPIN